MDFREGPQGGSSSVVQISMIKIASPPDSEGVAEAGNPDPRTPWHAECAHNEAIIRVIIVRNRGVAVLPT